MSAAPIPAIDMDKLNAFIGQFVTDLGASVHAGMVVIGEKLGLHKALATGPMSSAALARRTQTDERYLREWLASQAMLGHAHTSVPPSETQLMQIVAFKGGWSPVHNLRRGAVPRGRASIKSRILTPIALAIVLTIATSSASAQTNNSDRFVTIDVPGAASTGSTAADVRLKLNPQGQIAGGYLDSSGKTHGFLLSDDNFSTIDFPGAIFTTLSDISPSGDVVGIYEDSYTVLHGFLLSQGNLSKIDVPGAIATGPLGISPDGEVGGFFIDRSGHAHGFVFSTGTFTQIDYPGSYFTSVQAINAGRIIGVEFSDGKFHGYLLKNDKFTQIDFPGSVFTAPVGINPEGVIVGEYFTPDGISHGFKLAAAQFTTVDVPGAIYNFAGGINPQGEIVGKYETPDGKFHGYEFQ